jgi:hypothetical protein
MGFEIRRVPPNWEHPKEQYFDLKSQVMKERYVPLVDRDIQEVLNEWLNEEFEEKITENSLCSISGTNLPDRRFYRERWTEEPIWYQVYENTSEGTPVTPPFASEDEVVYYLVNYGTFSNPYKKWNKEVAEQFVKKTKYLLSGIAINGVPIDQTQSSIR